MFLKLLNWSFVTYSLRMCYAYALCNINFFKAETHNIQEQFKMSWDANMSVEGWYKSIYLLLKSMCQSKHYLLMYFEGAKRKIMKTKQTMKQTKYFE